MIYPVIDSVEALLAVIAGGAKIVQLRNKKLSKKDFYALALEFRKKTLENEVILIINDHMDIALAVKADGVHLGQEDLPLQVARRLAPEMIIGVSTHNLDEALVAEQSGATYINIGPIFKTQTKDMQPIGIEAIKQIAPKIKIPFTVMGGITLDNIDQVLKAGARRIAVVTAITRAENMKKATKELIGKINEFE